MTTIGEFEFELTSENTYIAKNIQETGDAVLGDWGEECTWTSFTLTVANGKIAKIVAVQKDVSEDYAGTYTYTLTFSKYGNISFEIPTVDSDIPVENEKELEDAFANFEDDEQWNFELSYKEFDDGETEPYDHVVLRYDGLSFSMKHLMDDGTYRTEIIVYEEDAERYAFYLDNGDGTYSRFYSDEDEAEFDALCDELYGFDIFVLAGFQFEKNGNHYSATRPDDAGYEFMGAYDGEVYSSLDVYLTNGIISKIISNSDVDGMYGAWTAEYVFEFSQYGSVTITAPEVTEPEKPETEHEGTAADPYTVADALAVAGSLSVGQFTGEVYLTGVVTKGDFSPNYAKNLYLSDGENEILVYSVNYTSTIVKGDVSIGCTVIIKGFLCNYNGTLEMTNKTINGNKVYPEFVSCEAGEEPETPAPQGTKLAATLDMLGNATRTSYSKTETVYAQNGITATIRKESSNNDNYDNQNSSYPARLYAGSTLEISYPNMLAIRIILDTNTYSGKTYVAAFDDMSVSGATLHREDGVLTITFSKAANSFLSEGLASQARIISIQVFVSDDGTPTPTPDPDVDIFDILAEYEDEADWNFNLQYIITVGGFESDNKVVNFANGNQQITYEYDGVMHTDYLQYDAASGEYFYYVDNGDGTYEKLTEDDEEFWDFYLYAWCIDLSEIALCEFTTTDNTVFTAKDPHEAGNSVLGDWGEDCTWTSFKLTIIDGKITKIVAVQKDVSEDYAGTYTFTLTFSNYGKVTVTLPGDNGGSEEPDPEEPANMMPTQQYDADNFDYENLQDKMRGDEGYSIGLPSTGDINVLVVPVQFSNTNISAQDLDKLNKAFNGTSTDTGWESVKSYYEKSSFGALNLSFDIWGVNIGTAGKPYVSANRYAVYDRQGGDERLLLEVLAYLDAQGVDLAQYDTNEDGAIDAVYIIYSAEVNYDDDNSIWWAYVTWYYDDVTFGDEEVSPYYYLFAGFDFMDEDADSADGYEVYGTIPGLKINASTYIHETGHLLGLDDYYDYDITSGSNRGLGGADMMDNTVGDQNVYSKIMLGWLNPTVITTTQTFTIDLSNAQNSDDCVMLLLNSDNSYFCEYLLIDLYSATGLNALHANLNDSFLYEGAEFGARIYHVTSWCDDPYSDDYGSFTNCNNSLSANALICLVEADGQNSKNTAINQGVWATSSDLWQTGDKLSDSFASYTRNDGKVVNFDIEFVSVTATSVTVTVTFVG